MAGCQLLPRGYVGRMTHRFWQSLLVLVVISIMADG
jgi:hypothetical protein